MRLYFHFCSDDGNVLDDEGIEVENMAVAAAEIHAAIRELQEELLSCLPFHARWELRVVDECGQLFKSLLINKRLDSAALLVAGLLAQLAHSLLQVLSNPLRLASEVALGF